LNRMFISPKRMRAETSKACQSLRRNRRSG
jgi:hypothetical protein